MKLSIVPYIKSRFYAGVRIGSKQAAVEYRNIGKGWWNFDTKRNLQNGLVVKLGF
jgi:hypothetical protein